MINILQEGNGDDFLMVSSMLTVLRRNNSYRGKNNYLGRIWIFRSIDTLIAFTAQAKELSDNEAFYQNKIPTGISNHNRPIFHYNYRISQINSNVDYRISKNPEFRIYRRRITDI